MKQSLDQKLRTRTALEHFRGRIEAEREALSDARQNLSDRDAKDILDTGDALLHCLVVLLSSHLSRCSAV